VAGDGIVERDRIEVSKPPRPQLPSGGFAMKSDKRIAFNRRSQSLRRVSVRGKNYRKWESADRFAGGMEARICCRGHQSTSGNTNCAVGDNESDSRELTSKRVADEVEEGVRP
jgi:hypothetical protein